MTSTVFPSRIRTITAALASLGVIVALLAYLTVPAPAAPTMAASYKASSQPLLSGVVKGSKGRPLSRARVLLVFRGERRRGNSYRRVYSRSNMGVDGRGRYSRPIPRGARVVRVVVFEREGRRARRTTRTIRIRPGRSIDLTAVFPPRRSGLLPGLFPY